MPKKTLCGVCGQAFRIYYDKRPRRVRDLSCGDKRDYLDFQARRVSCSRCGGVKREQLDWLADTPCIPNALTMKFAAPEKDTRMQQMQFSATPVGSPDGQFRTISFTLVTGDKAMLIACAEALGRVRAEAKGTLGALRLALRDLDDGVRWAALCALLESGQDTREVVPILLNFVRDKDAVLRRAAVEALGKSDSEAKLILPALTTAS